MSKSRQRVNRRGPISKGILRSLAQSYAEANRQAGTLVNAYRRNLLALNDLRGEIERGIARAETLARFARDAVREQWDRTR